MESSLESLRPRPAASRARRVLMNAVALGLLYGNAAVALQPPAIRAAPVHLPCPAFVVDAFLMTGMFNSYSLVNTDPFISAQRTQTGSMADRGLWIELPVREHFVQRQGVTFVELFSAHEWDMHGTTAQQRSWVFLARRIREHHNWLHPERPVARVGFGNYEWPQSAVAYRALKRPSTLRSRAWYMEPERL
jgi:hypothetical protein